MHSRLKKIILSSQLAILGAPALVYADSISLKNPLDFSGDDAMANFLNAIVNIFQIVLTPFVVFFIIYSGYLFVIARGNQETLDRAKKALMYAVIGGVIIAGAAAIGVIVKNTADAF